MIDYEYLDDPLALAVLFHATYEKLAPNSSYNTRQETRIFDPESPNGKLMIATCAEIQKVIKMERAIPGPSLPNPNQRRGEMMDAHIEPLDAGIVSLPKCGNCGGTITPCSDECDSTCCNICEGCFYTEYEVE